MFCKKTIFYYLEKWTNVGENIKFFFFLKSFWMKNYENHSNWRICSLECLVHDSWRTHSCFVMKISNFEEQFRSTSLKIWPKLNEFDEVLNRIRWTRQIRWTFGNSKLTNLKIVTKFNRIYFVFIEQTIDQHSASTCETNLLSHIKILFFSHFITFILSHDLSAYTNILLDETTVSCCVLMMFKWRKQKPSSQTSKCSLLINN